jgi:protein-L-isoaspartate(D-aspartate) O-methyltransferase
MEDSFRHKGLRKKLIQQLRDKGIKNDAVLEAMNNVPRHLFMDSGFIHFSYQDKAFPIGAGQTISQPYTVAYQTQLLNPRKLEKVLEVGTGSGYQSAILMELKLIVFTIERQRELFLKAQDQLKKLGYNPRIFYGDGYAGLPTYGPFDKILVTAGAPSIPGELLDQLKVGGRMVVPVGGKTKQVMTLIEKTDKSNYIKSEHGTFLFVPMLKGKQT